MNISHSHRTTQVEAIRHLQGFLPNLLQEYREHITEAQHSWSGNVMSFSFRLRRFHIKGSMTASETQVVLEAELPFVVSPFEGQIKQSISRKLQELFPPGQP